MTTGELEEQKKSLAKQYETLRDQTNQVLGALKLVNQLIEKEENGASAETTEAKAGE